MRGDSRGFSSIVLDFDSTVSAIEGIDVLAGPHRDRVREMTERAMSGELPLEAVYGERLALIRPSRSDVERLAEQYVDALVPDAADTIAALGFLGKHVRIVSGGLLQAIVPVALRIGLAAEAVGAVGVEFAPDGGYLDFDRSSPLARAGGKADVIRGWDLPRPVLLVGDGATDLEARPAVDAFAAFTGVARRPAVAAAADVVISMRSLAPVLAIVASVTDRAALMESRWRSLLVRGEAALDRGVRT